MAPFKCWGCNNWKDGEGTNICLSCDILRIKDYSYKPVCLEPEIIEHLAPSTVNPSLFDSLTEVEFTYVAQVTLGKMSHDRIANYHGVTVQNVSKTIKRAEKKLKRV